MLRTAADEVVEFDESLAQLVDDMFASMYAAEGVGLAANQIGVGLSVFVFDCPDASGRHQVGHVVNPVLVSAGGEIDDDYEGCLSIPGLHYETDRASYAAVEGKDADRRPGPVRRGRPVRPLPAARDRPPARPLVRGPAARADQAQGDARGPRRGLGPALLTAAYYRSSVSSAAGTVSADRSSCAAAATAAATATATLGSNTLGTT